MNGDTSHVAVVVNRQRQRLLEILRRHVRADDADLSDHDFLSQVWGRYAEARSAPLIDPNE